MHKRWLSRPAPRHGVAVARACRMRRPAARRVRRRDRIRHLAIACERPSASDRPITGQAWSQQEVADASTPMRRRQRGVVKDLAAGSQRSVGRFFKRVGVKPHRIRYWPSKPDERFDDSARHLRDLRRSQRADDGVRTVSVDEMTGIQASSAQPRRWRSSRAWSNDGNTVIRHGTQMIAGFDVATGQVCGIIRRIEELRPLPRSADRTARPRPNGNRHRQPEQPFRKRGQMGCRSQWPRRRSRGEGQKRRAALDGDARGLPARHRPSQPTSRRA